MSEFRLDRANSSAIGIVSKRSDGRNSKNIACSHLREGDRQRLIVVVKDFMLVSK